MAYSKIRVGSVPYLNAKPLVYGLTHEKNVELSFDIPSLLATKLKEKEVDVALIPAISYFSIENLSIVPEICISSDGAVKSVRLFSKVAVKLIKKVAIDRSSLSSAALVKILLTEKYDLSPKYISCDPKSGFEAFDSDAMLLIGDRAMKQSGEGFFTLDLGAEWQSFAGLPFVYAFWAVRPEIRFEGLSELLQKAKCEGLKAIEQIAKEASMNLGMDETVCRSYLQENIKYELGEAQLLGLQLFHKYALKFGLVTKQTEVRFYKADCGSRNKKLSIRIPNSAFRN
jgi:chorismate dehydratase